MDCPPGFKAVDIFFCNFNNNGVLSTVPSSSSEPGTWYGPGSGNGECIKIDGVEPTQSDVGKWVDTAWTVDVTGVPVHTPTNNQSPPFNGFGGYIPLQGPFKIAEVYPNPTPTSPTGSAILHDFHSNPNVKSCNPLAWLCSFTHVSNPCVFVGNLSGLFDGNDYGITWGSPGSDDCVNGCHPSWDCRTDKFGNSGCVATISGGVYNSLIDCQNSCEPTEQVFIDRFKDIIIEPWIDEEFGGCKTDIWTCPCGWSYDENYQGIFTQFAGMKMCISPNYGAYQIWAMNNPGLLPLGWAASGGWLYIMNGAHFLPCVEQQGLFHPVLGMSVKSHSQSPNPQAFGPPGGPLGITYTFGGHTYTDNWDKHVIVAVEHAFNTSLAAYIPWIQPASPC
jgi:hypothetical protein